MFRAILVANRGEIAVRVLRTLREMDIRGVAVYSDAVRGAGLAFVGPPPEAMARVGNKIAARRLLAASGVPVVPGMVDPEPDPARLADRAAEIGYPLLLK